MNKNNPKLNPTSESRLKFGKMLKAPKALPQLTRRLHPRLTGHPQQPHGHLNAHCTPGLWVLLHILLPFHLKKRLGNNLEKQPLTPLLLHPLPVDLSDILKWRT